MVVVPNKGADLPLEIAGQEVVLEEDAALHRLMPAVDLALRHRMIWRPARVDYARIVQPDSQIGGDVAVPAIRWQPRSFVSAIEPRSRQRHLARRRHAGRLNDEVGWAGDQPLGSV